MHVTRIALFPKFSLKAASSQACKKYSIVIIVLH